MVAAWQPAAARASYVSQFFPLDAAVARRELYIFHKMLSLPPNSFRKVDLIAMAGWSPPPVIQSAQVLAVASAARSAAVTLSGDWEPFADRLAELSWNGTTLQDAPRWQAGAWSPPFWSAQTSIVQSYRSLLSNAAQKPFSSQSLAAAARAA
eukprot:8751037-Pyramimonas_sp.AAC.1